MDFDWDEVNIRHLARHNVTPRGAEEIFNEGVFIMDNHYEPADDLTPDEDMIVIQRFEDIPKFASEDEEAEFWDTHSIAPHLWHRGPRPGSLLEKYQQRLRAEAQPQIPAPSHALLENSLKDS